MPEFTFTGPGGATKKVTANSRDDAIKGFKVWYRGQTQPSPVKPSQEPVTEESMKEGLDMPTGPHPAAPYTMRPLELGEKPHEGPIMHVQEGDPGLPGPGEVLSRTGRRMGEDIKAIGERHKAPDPFGIMGIPRTIADIGNIVNLPLDIGGGLAESIARHGPHAPGGEKGVGDVAQALMPLPPIGKAGVLARALTKMGEEGRTARYLKHAQLASNVEEQMKAGVTPSMALAATTDATRRATDVLSKNILLGGPLRGRLKQAFQQWGDRWEKLATSRTGRFAPERAGEQIQQGARRFQATSPATTAALKEATPTARAATIASLKRTPVRVAGFGRKSTALYSEAEELLGPLDHPIGMSNTAAALRAMVHPFTDPGLNAVFRDSTVGQLLSTLKANGGRLTFEDARRMRSELRNMFDVSGDPQLRANFKEADIRRLYGAMTMDLQEGAGVLGTVWGGQARGVKAAAAWKRADTYYRAGMDRIDNALAKTYGPNATPASVFRDLMGAAQGGARQDLQRLLQVRRSVSPDEWEAFTSSVIDQMGRATPSAETMHQPFSMQTFLTNFNRLNEQAAREGSGADTGLKVLFGGYYGNEHRAGELAVDNLAKVASQLRDLQRVRNVSESGSHIGNFMSGGLLVGGFAYHNPLAAVTMMLTGNAASSLLASERFVKWYAGLPTRGSPGETEKALEELLTWGPAGAATATGASVMGNPAQAQQQQPQAQPAR